MTARHVKSMPAGTSPTQNGPAEQPNPTRPTSGDACPEGRAKRRALVLGVWDRAHRTWDLHRPEPDHDALEEYASEQCADVLA